MASDKQQDEKPAPKSSFGREVLREELQAFAESSMRSALLELRGWMKEDLHSELLAGFAASRTSRQSQWVSQRDSLDTKLESRRDSLEQATRDSSNLGHQASIDTYHRSGNSLRSVAGGLPTLPSSPLQLKRGMSLNTQATFGRKPLAYEDRALNPKRPSHEVSSVQPMSSIPNRQIVIPDSGLHSPELSVTSAAFLARSSDDRHLRPAPVSSDLSSSICIVTQNGSGSRSFSRVPRAKSLMDTGDSDEDGPEGKALLDDDKVRKFVPRGRHSTFRIADPKSGWLTKIVESPYFETAVGLFVLANAVFIGFGIDSAAQNERNLWVDAAGPFFAIVFSLELLCRCTVAGKLYFLGDQWMWNVFDVVMVVLQIMDECSVLFRQSLQKSNLSAFRMLRIVRLIRVTRLIRLVHLFADLKSMVTSMVNSVGALFWAMVLLFMIIYMFSVLCMAIILEIETKMDDQLDYYFGSMPRTALTMFECVVGGVNWDEVVMLLVTKISPWMGLIFCMYLTVSLFAVTNLVTGVFVDKAMQMTREDKDTYLANRISHLFFMSGGDYIDEVTWETFQEKLSSEAMQEYFKVLNLDIAEARGLFDLLDADRSGSVSTFEVVSGCLRLRGPAKALDLALLIQDVTRIEAMLEDLCLRL